METVVKEHSVDTETLMSPHRPPLAAGTQAGDSPSSQLSGGKSPISQASTAGIPYKEQQLKQLRAQCVVYMAFKNGLVPKKRHLEIALENIYTKEEDGVCRDLNDPSPSRVQEVSRSLERPDITNLSISDTSSSSFIKGC